jgi:hypothetical protein
MTISTILNRPHFIATIAFLAFALFSSGCPSAEKAPDQPQPKPKAKAPSEISAKQKSPAKDSTEEEEDQPKSRDLGAPLVDALDKLKRLDQKQPIWIDPVHKHVVLLGEVCKAGYPLEFFATYSNRSYEAVVAVNVKPSIVHAGLLAVGAEAGHPAKFQPKFIPPTGTEVAIEVRWKDAKGKVQSAPAQHWIRNIKTKKELDQNWVFAGSGFVTDEETGKQYYQADSGELICVLSLPNAMLDLPIQSYGAIEARSFEAFAEHLPPPGTPVTLLLKPVLKDKQGNEKSEYKSSAADKKNPEAEKQALEAGQPWLALVDQGEYTRSWETAAEHLKDAVERKDLVKSLAAVRKTLGKVKSREVASKQFSTKLPGKPDGQYVVIQFKTSFENKASAIETVTSMLDKDKKWRVSDYSIE